MVERSVSPSRLPKFRSRRGKQGLWVFSRRRVLFGFLIILFFCQIYWEIGGITLRTEDVLSLVLITGFVLKDLPEGKLRFPRSPLTWPLVGCLIVLGLSVFVTLSQPFPRQVKWDAVVNGVRLFLALGLYFVVLRYPISPSEKRTILIRSVIGFSLLTTSVALLQIAYWDGWGVFSLPRFLIEFKEGANTDPGREIFALFVGDTNTHVWAAMLAVQTLTVFLYARTAPSGFGKWILIGYFVVLYSILIRTSVRNSIVGLLVALVLLEVMYAWRSRYPFNREIKLALLGLAVILILAFLYFVPRSSYFLDRIRQVLPRVSEGGLVIDRRSNLYGRITYAQAAVELFRERPVLGYGFWSYADLASQRLGQDVVHAHNSYVQILAEMGLIGFAVFVWLARRLWYVMRFSWRSVPRSRDQRIMRDLLLGNLLFVGITAWFSNPFWNPKQVGFLSIVLGVWLSEVGMKKNKKPLHQ